MWQVIQLIVFYGLILAIVILLFLIWLQNLTRSVKQTIALVDVAMKSAETSNKSSDAAVKSSEAALKAAEAALKAVEVVRILASQLEKA